MTRPGLRPIGWSTNNICWSPCGTWSRTWRTSCWYNHKSLYLSCNRKIDKAIQSPQLVDDLIQGFGMAASLYHYLLDTIVQAKQPR